jgi:hypothetical protein
MIRKGVDILNEIKDLDKFQTILYKIVQEYSDSSDFNKKLWDLNIKEEDLRAIISYLSVRKMTIEHNLNKATISIEDYF